MLRTLYGKTIRDHALAAAVAVLSLFLIMWMGLWAYAGVDDADTFLLNLPDEYIELLGITRDSGTAGLMVSTMFSIMGPFVLAGLALSWGATSIAGEEREGTMNVLTSAPRSRARLLTSKSAAIATLVILANLVTCALYYVAGAIVGSDLSSLQLGAATVHVTAVALVYGAIALAIGAATGNRSLASGVTTGLLIVSFLAAGLMPMFSGWEDVAKAFPWYYIDGASPLVNGVDWAQIAGLTAVVLALFGVGLWAIGRRDLLAGGGRRSLLAKLRTNPRLAMVLDRLQGAGSARGLVSKSVSDQRGLTTIAGVALFMFLVLIGPLFNLLGDTFGDIMTGMPDALLAMIGYADYSTPTGWYHGEALSIYGPLVVAIVGISAGAALAGEEKRHTIGVLLAAPISRARVAVAKYGAMTLLAVLMALVLFLGIVAGNGVANLGMGIGNIAAAGALVGALGFAFGGAAYLCGAATGRSSAAVWGGTGVAVAAWAINTFVGVNEDLEWFAKISPFYWALHAPPLDEGMNWLGFAVLVGEGLVLGALGVWAYQRRDLKP